MNVDKELDEHLRELKLERRILHKVYNAIVLENTGIEELEKEIEKLDTMINLYEDEDSLL